MRPDKRARTTLDQKSMTKGTSANKLVNPAGEKVGDS